MKKTIYNTPGRFSRRCGEQVANSDYAQAFDDGHKPKNWWDIAGWIASAVLLWGAFWWLPRTWP